MEELENRMRLTNHQQVLVEEFRKVTTHPTADELCDMVRQRLPRIGLATIYRNLELLSECGIINKLVTGHKKKRFDGNPHPHYHIQCINCGRVDDILIPWLEDLDESCRLLLLQDTGTPIRIQRHLCRLQESGDQLGVFFNASSFPGGSGYEVKHWNTHPFLTEMKESARST